MSPPRVEASGLVRRIARGAGGSAALRYPDVTLKPGEMVAVVGPSLSGKTTLVNLLAGWDRPDAGTVAWNGNPIAPPWPRLTVVPQGFAVLDELTVRENIVLARRLAGHRQRDGASADALGEIVDALGLGRLQDRGVQEVSVGERQRTMVARALVDHPDVVLADEPVAHQDQHNAGIVIDLLRAAVTQGTACLVATRDPAIVERADRTITL